MRSTPATSDEASLGQARKMLEETGYRFVGTHSALRLCHWNKLSLQEKGCCFKDKWYGNIESNRCLQMTPSVQYCTQQCRFCWCVQPWGTAPFAGADDPADILEGCLEHRRQLLHTARSEMWASPRRFQEALNPTHVGICLSGEPCLYPEISELIEEIHHSNMTTHLVTNGTLPERLEAMDTLPTHLFVSLYAPDEMTYFKTCRPLVSDAWAKVNSTLRLLPTLRCPSTVELTLVKGLNMIEAREYAKLIEVADPVTVHLKVVQRTGDAVKRIPEEAVPEWEEVEKFAEQISNETGYVLKDQVFPYAILLAR
jgi:tRNA wybutosine-synthesizing protein 1